MPNANWSSPTLTSTYTNFVAEVKNRDEDLALQFDGTTSTNIPTNTIRWDSTANRWKKWNGSSWVELTGTYALTALTTTGSVGIGTTTPRGLVSIANNAAGTGVVDSSLHFGYSLADHYGHRIVNSNEPSSQAAGLLKFQRGTTAAWVDSVVIDDSGRVGIGTSSPTQLLSLAGTSANILLAGTSNSYTTYNIGASNVGYVGDANWIFAGSSSDFGIRATSNLVFGIGATERLRIDSSGRVGIGTASPGYVLDVVGTVNANATFRASNGTHIGIFGSEAFAAGVVGVGSGSNHPLVFGTNSAERARIDSSGRVGIGTTSPRFALSIGGTSIVSSATPDTLDLGATISSTAGANPKLRLYETGAGGSYGLGISAGQLDYMVPSTGSHVFFVNATERLRIGSSGQLGLGGANYGTVGQVLTSAGASAAPSWATPLTLGSVITAGTSVASTSGTSVDFTGIPSWVKRITVMFNGVSTTGTSLLQVQVGDAGGIETTGYAGSSGSQSASSAGTVVYPGAGFYIFDLGAAAAVYSGVVGISSFGGNTWVGNGVMGRSDTTRSSYTAGSKTLSATLDRIRITTVNGTDTFDAGAINILYEG